MAYVPSEGRPFSQQASPFRVHKRPVSSGRGCRDSVVLSAFAPQSAPQRRTRHEPLQYSSPWPRRDARLCAPRWQPWSRCHHHSGVATGPTPLTSLTPACPPHPRTLTHSLTHWPSTPSPLSCPKPCRRAATLVEAPPPPPASHSHLCVLEMPETSYVLHFCKARELAQAAAVNLCTNSKRWPPVATQVRALSGNLHPVPPPAPTLISPRPRPNHNSPEPVCPRSIPCGGPPAARPRPPPPPCQPAQPTSPETQTLHLSPRPLQRPLRPSAAVRVPLFLSLNPAAPMLPVLRPCCAPVHHAAALDASSTA